MRTIIFSDSRVALGMIRRSSVGDPLIVLTSIVIAIKDIRVAWIPTAANPADFLSRHPHPEVTSHYFAVARQTLKHLDEVRR